MRKVSLCKIQSARKILLSGNPEGRGDYQVPTIFYIQHSLQVSSLCLAFVVSIFMDHENGAENDHEENLKTFFIIQECNSFASIKLLSSEHLEQCVAIFSSNSLTKKLRLINSPNACHPMGTKTKHE